MKKGMVLLLIAALTGCLLFTACTALQTTAPAAAQTVVSAPTSGITLPHASSTSDASQISYGVFLGLNPEDMERLSGYSLVVIDAAYYTAEQVVQMHAAGQTVYTYLNIGAVERFRDYYDEYEPLTLGAYENWPNERWVDVSQPEWRDFITGTLAASLAEKQVDGFFLDNADVYDVYPREEIYQGLIAILTGLRAYGLPLVVNGGDTFVTALMEDGRTGLLGGVNQESVFTSVDFDHGTFGVQDDENREYYLEHLSRCRDAGLSVYLLEYASDPGAVEPEIAAYCAENGFLYYISDDLELDGWPGSYSRS